MSLAEGLKSRGHRSVHTIEKPEQLAPLIRGMAKPGDIVMCLGAGTITPMGLCAAGPARSLRQGSAVMGKLRRRGPAEAPAAGAWPAGGQCAPG